MELKMSKPPYCVPSMEEIAAVRGISGYRSVSTFSGCGGSCLGFEMAGFSVAWANEVSPEARASHHPNFPHTVLDGRDIRNVTAAEILSAIGALAGELEVFEGSPPCDSFSTAGSREKKWGKVKASSSGTNQRTDDLFFEYARLVDGLRPKVFVAENVSGLTKGTAVGYFKLIHRKLAGLGYRVEAKMLDAQWLGVPQVRKRVIFMGVREDLAMSPRWPPPLPYHYSTADVLPHLADARQAIGNDAFKPIFGGAQKVHPTITASGARTSGLIIEGTENKPRQFTIPELLRICGFPDDFKLSGTFQQQWSRLGNCVPPVMMFHVARCVREILDATAS